MAAGTTVAGTTVVVAITAVAEVAEREAEALVVLIGGVVDEAGGGGRAAGRETPASIARPVRTRRVAMRLRYRRRADRQTTASGWRWKACSSFRIAAADSFG